MAAPRDEYSLIISPVPPLFVMALAKKAVSLLKEFGFRSLVEAAYEIEEENLATEGGREKTRRAKKSLLEVPEKLRQRVMEAVHGTHQSTVYWRGYYQYLIGLTDVEGCFQFRPDGTIDAVKSAQNLVRNPKFDIKKRFEVACLFCLVESVEALWSEMVASGEAESFGTRLEDVVSFWVKWLKEQPRVTSPQSFIQSLGTLIPENAQIFDSTGLYPRFSAMFPFWQTEQRQKCFDLLDAISLDDLRFCFYTLTNEEVEIILNKGATGLLRLYLTWPLQSLFIKAVAKLQDYIDVYCFRQLLMNILLAEPRLKDYNYSALFEEFWKTGRPDWRENWNGWPHLKLKVDSYFERKRRELADNRRRN